MALLALWLALVAAPAAARAPMLSVSQRLDDRRYVAAGTRAYVLGTEDGGFPAMGFHTRGEMGGIWTPPLKLLDEPSRRPIHNVGLDSGLTETPTFGHLYDRNVG
jgi:hypothetical protein